MANQGTAAADTGDTAQNLAAVKARIAEAAATAGRDAAAVELVAVSKTFGADRISEALEAGHRLFGENRVQESEDKWPALREAWPDARLHLIGPLQTNKVKTALRVFDAIETVDRPKLARALARGFEETGRPLDCFIQVNTGEEPQKAGVLPADADAFIAACRDDFGLPVRGLMCLPPMDEDPSPHFALLRRIAERNGLVALSMGMTADFEVAVAFGATLVRVGTAVFGRRPPFKPSPG